MVRFTNRARKSGWGLLLALLFYAYPLQAETTSSLISIDVQDLAVCDAVRLFADLGKRNLVCAVSGEGLLSLSLKDVTWEEAFRAFLRLKRLYVEDLDGISIIRPLAELPNKGG